jgi:hypothetical protein
MAWEIEMVQIVRNLIGDVSETSPTYSIPRLQTMILTAGQLLNGSVDFYKSYTIDVDEGILTPDPTTATKDNGFINLVCLKTACIILRSEWRTASNSALSVKDGPSTIDGKGIATAKEALANEMCEAFEDALKQYLMGNSKAGEAIVGPHRYGYVNRPPDHRTRPTFP